MDVAVARALSRNQPQPIDTNPPDRTQHQQQGSDFRQGRGQTQVGELQLISG